MSKLFDSLSSLGNQTEAVRGILRELRNLDQWKKTFEKWFGDDRRGLIFKEDPSNMMTIVAEIERLGGFDNVNAENSTIDQDSKLAKFIKACQKRNLKKLKTIPRKILFEIMVEIGEFKGEFKDFDANSQVCRLGRYMASISKYSKKGSVLFEDENVRKGTTMNR